MGAGPMNTLIKMAPILLENEFAKILPIAWELLLAKDQDRVASAASIIILCSGKREEKLAREKEIPCAHCSLYKRDLRSSKLARKKNAYNTHNSIVHKPVYTRYKLIPVCR